MTKRKINADPRRQPLSAERIEAARRMIEDGASQTEITRTLGLARETIVRHFPGAGWTPQSGWTPAEIGAYGRMIRTAKHQGLL